MKTIRHLLLLTLLAVIGFAANATRTFTVSGIQYSTADTYNGLCTANKYVGTGTTVSIPTAVTNPDDSKIYRVNQIGYQFAKGNTKITSVEVLWGTTIILNEAFANCTALTKVNLPSSCTSFYQRIFEGCSKLEYIAYAGTKLPNQSYDTNFPSTKCKLYMPRTSTVTSADVQAAYGYQNISAFEKNNIPYDFYYGSNNVSIKAITDGAYTSYTGDGLASKELDITIVNAYPQGTGSVSLNAAASFTASGTTPKLKYVAIGPYAFDNKTALTSINTTNATYLKTIGDGAFRNCTALTTATIKAETIGASAFSGCTALNSITLAEGVKTLGSGIIRGTAVTSLKLPASLESFGYAADGAKQLISLYAAEGNPNYAGYYGTLYNKDLTTLIRQPEGRNLVSFTDKVTTIAAYAFQECDKLEETIELPYGMKIINSYAFLRATGMKTLVIPSSVSTLGYRFMAGCTGLTDLYLNFANPFAGNLSNLFGDSYATMVPNITLHLPYADGIDTAYKNKGWTGFKEYNATLLQAYDFALNLTNFGKAYYSITSTGASNYQDEDDVWRGYDGTVKLLRGEGTVAKGEVTIPTVVTYRGKTYGVTGLGTMSLYGDGTETNQFSVKGGWLVNKIEYTAGGVTQSLTAVDLPNVTTIDNAAFTLSVGLKSFEFSPKITTIGDNAFNMTTKLSQNVYLPYGVKTVGASAFANSAITTLRIPSSVTKLGDTFVSNNQSMSQLIVNVPTKVLADGSTEIYSMPDNMKVYVPVGQVEQFKQHIAFTRIASKVEAGAFDFIFGYSYNTRYHMSVMSPINGDFTDPESGEKTHYDGWATYVYHPNIKTADGFTFDHIETDRITGKNFLMVALGDSVFAGTSLMEEIDGPTSSLLVIGHHAFEGCAVKHDLTFDIPFTIGEQAFANMPNCPSVTILTPLDLSSSFNDSYIFDGNKDDFEFYVDNKYFKKAYDKCLDWDMADGHYAGQLRPFIRAEAEVMPVSCYLGYTNYAAAGLNAYSVTGYDLNSKTLKLTKLDENTLNHNEVGVILTDLEPGEIYKLQPWAGGEGLTSTEYWNNYLTENWEEWTLKSDDSLRRWGWDAENKKFVHPATSMTIPGGSALLYIGDNDAALNIDEWALTVSNPLDVNNDGSVNVGDVNAVLAEILAHPDGDGDSKYDVSGDGSVNVGDVNVILAYILEHPDE